MPRGCATHCRCNGRPKTKYRLTFAFDSSRASLARCANFRIALSVLLEIVFFGIKINLAKHYDTPMRILMVAPQPFYEDRGTPIVLRRVLQATSQCGYQVDMITFPGGETVSIDGLRIFRVGKFLRIRNIPIGFSFKKLILDIFLLPAMIRRLRRRHYDCIHAVEEAAFPALIASRLFAVPLLYDMQSSLPEQLKGHRVFALAPILWTLRRLETFLVRRVAFVGCSVGLRQHVKQIAPATPAREWLYPAVDAVPSSAAPESLRSSLDIPADSFVILYAGNFAAYQGVDRLAQAIPFVLAEIPNAVFVFVGSKIGESVPGLDARQIAELPVRVVPRQPREHMAAYLSIAHAVVSPRHPTGNLPLKVLDYMASGKPIVATDSSAHRSVLHDDSAMLVEHKPAAIAAAVVMLYKDPELAERLAGAALKISQEKLGWNVFLNEIQNIYEGLQQQFRSA